MSNPMRSVFSSAGKIYYSTRNSEQKIRVLILYKFKLLNLGSDTNHDFEFSGLWMTTLFSLLLTKLFSISHETFATNYIQAETNGLLLQHYIA